MRNSSTINRYKNKIISAFLKRRYSKGRNIKSLKNEGTVPPIVVSMTSFSPRLDNLYIALGSLFNQSLQPNKIVLYLGDDVEKEKIPESIKKLVKHGLEIRFVDDLKSHKKYYYSLREYGDSLVVTVDDDLIYHKDMIKKLYDTYCAFPECICAMRTHEILYDGQGIPLPYSKWIKNSQRYNVASTDLFFTSGAGTLFPPHCFDERAFDLETIKKLSFSADDVWLNCMCRLIGRKIVNVPLNNHERSLLKINHTQDQALKFYNLYDSGNDTAVKNLVNEFGKESFR